MKSMLNVRLAEARMTKRELIKRAGISSSTIGRYSQDKEIERAAMPTLTKIVDAIGCSVKDLFEE